MRSLLLLALLLSACIIIDADATDLPDAAPPPRIDASNAYCPPPDQGKMMICGRVLDLQDSSLVDEPLRIEFYDALNLVTAAAPEDRLPPLMVTTSDPGGTFRAVVGGDNGIASPPSFIAVVTDDVGGGDLRIATAVALPAAANTTVELLAFATPRASVFADHEDSGAIVSIFLDLNRPALGWLPGTPVAGVTVTEAGSPRADRDAYFLDAEPHLRTELSDSATSTGPSGSALYFGGEVVPYGGNSPGCVWQARNAGNVPTLMLVALYEAYCGP